MEFYGVSYVQTQWVKLGLPESEMMMDGLFQNSGCATTQYKSQYIASVEKAAHYKSLF